MNPLVLPLIALAAFAAAGCTTLATPSAAGGPPPMPTYEGSAEFRLLKTLAGKWEGSCLGMPMPVTAEYRVTGGGSVVEERLFGGTPMEMLTTYHEVGGKLGLTHYCALHNQPRMRLARSTARTLEFDYAPSPGIDPAKDDHMHSLKMTFVGANQVKAAWSHWKGGKPQPGHEMTLQRKN